jgi:peptidoglycan/xylan/chitin deacetylase (PgdA/CDA1 family)
LTTLSDQEIKAEFERTESIVTNISSNITLKPYFRPPYGARNQHVWDYTASLGYQSIYWTVDAWDWKTDVSAQIVKQRIFDNVKNGAIILMHVGDDITPAILSEVITNLEAKGFTLGNLESVLAD